MELNLTSEKQAPSATNSVVRTRIPRKRGLLTSNLVVEEIPCEYHNIHRASFAFFCTVSKFKPIHSFVVYWVNVGEFTIFNPIPSRQFIDLVSFNLLNIT